MAAPVVMPYADSSSSLVPDQPVSTGVSIINLFSPTSTGRCIDFVIFLKY